MEEGDRIAQIIFEKICTPEVQEVDVSTSHLFSLVGDVVTSFTQQDLGPTDRGTNGFGSTGGHSLLN